MANKNIRGITIEIGGDTTKLGKAIEDSEKKSRSLQSELKEIDRALKFDPSNVELLAQRQTVLTQNIEETSKKLDTLKEAEKQVIEQFKRGEVAEEQVRALQREIIKTEGVLGSMKSELSGVDNNLDDVGDSARESSEGFTIMKGALADLTANAIQGIISSIGDLVGSLFELSEATEEYRVMQSKLEGSANSFGYSVDFAKSKYEEFYKYLGDDQMSTNAITNLMGLGTSTESISKIAEGAIGVWSAYGDSIPIESLTESINETAQVGKITGTLADALNWAGISEDDFNAKLEKTNSTQERADLIAQVLNDTYGESKKTYDELSGSVSDANEAELALKDTQAELGEAMAPVNTAITDLKNKALEAILPLVEKTANAFMDLLKWLEENPVAMKILTTVVIALTTAFTILAGALAIQGIISGVTKAMALLNATLLANPIVLIVALIAGLVAGFIHLWNTSEEFRNFWIGLWEAVKNAVGIAVDWIVGLFNTIVDFVKNNWQGLLLFIVNPFAGAFKLLYDNFEGFRNFVDGIVTAVKDFFIGLGTSIAESFSTWWTNIVTSITTARDTVVGIISGIWSKVIEIFSPAIEWFSSLFRSISATLSDAIDVIVILVTGTWELIKAVFGIVSTWFSENVVEPVKKAFTAMWTTVRNLASSAWNFISGVFSTVSNWFNTRVVEPIKNAFTKLWNTTKSLASSAWNGIKGIWGAVSGWFNSKIISPVSNFFSGMWNKLKTGASGAWTGIKNVFSNVTSWFREKFSSAWTAVKNVFSSGGAIFSGIKDGIASAFKRIVNTLIRGINRVVRVPFNAINKALSKIRGVSIAGISPFSGLPSISVPQIPLLYRGGILKKGQVGILEGNGAEAVVPLEKETGWINRIAQTMNELQEVNTNSSNVALASKMDEMISTMKALRSTIVLDTGVLVGETINQIDDRLGNNYSMRERRI